MRHIATYGTGRNPEVADVLQAIFVAELMSPSAEIWVVSPWVSDIPILDNQGGEFAVIVPASSFRAMSLVDVLGELAERGALVHLVTRMDASNSFVLQRLQALAGSGGFVDVRLRERVHHKGLLTSRVYVSGSMNFTFSGEERNEEGVTVDADPDMVARMFVEFAGRFGAAGEHGE